MRNMIALFALAVGLLASPAANAGERTVTLAVENMYCALCPLTVRKSLEAVPGVKSAVVSYASRSAVVVYDDGGTDLAALTKATTNAGYPSAPKHFGERVDGR